MTEITRPDPQDLFNTYRDMVSNTILGGAQVIPESNEWYLAALQYAQGETWYALADQFRKELDPRTACADNLVDMASRDGVFPLPAQPAQGFINISGAPGTVLPVPLSFQIDGQEFVTASIDGQPGQLDANGNATIRVRALVPGAAGNLPAGLDVTFNPSTTPGTPNPAGATAEMAGGFCEGSDAETTEQFRARYLARLQFTPRATAQFIRSKLAEWPCVTRVIDRVGTCCSPEGGDTGQRLGCGQVECGDCGCEDCAAQLQYYVLFDNAFENGIAPESVLAEIERWMFGSPQGYGLGQAEVGTCGRIVPVTPVEVTANISVIGCANQAQIEIVRQAVVEFFDTLAPSQVVDTTDLRITLQRLLGGEVDFAVEFIPADNGQFFGGVYGPRNDNSLVMVTPCGFEPVCDVMLVTNSIIIRTVDGTF